MDSSYFSSLHGSKLTNFPQETVSMLKNTCSHRWNSFLCDCWTSYIFEAIMSTTARLVSEQDSWSLSELSAPTQLKFQRRSTLKKTHWKRFTVAHFEVFFLTSWSATRASEKQNTSPSWWWSYKHRSWVNALDTIWNTMLCSKTFSGIWKHTSGEK